MKNKAFTLVEVVVSMVISTLLLTIVLGSFWLLIKINRKNEIAGELQRQTSFAMMRISDKIKNNSIDYQAYSYNSSSICQNLSLVSGTQNRLCLQNGYEFKQKKKKLFMNGQPLLGDDFEVDYIDFFVSPSVDPFSDISKIDIQLQPKVTIKLRVKSKKYEDIFLEVQSTISSRKYQK